MKTYQIALYPGDGIGAEVIEQAVRVLEAAYCSREAGIVGMRKGTGKQMLAIVLCDLSPVLSQPIAGTEAMAAKEFAGRHRAFSGGLDGIDLQ